jgi:CRP-like cAMP-binding protein
MSNFIWDNILKLTHDERSIKNKLKACYLFQDLNLHELQLLAKIVKVRNYRPGEVVFRQGEPGIGLYIIGSGIVNIYVEEIIPETGEARSSHIVQLKSQEFFGDLALVESDGPRTATAMAHEESQLITFFKPDLTELTNRNPGASVKVLLRLGEVLGARLKETTAQLSSLKQVSE